MRGSAILGKAEEGVKRNFHEAINTFQERNIENQVDKYCPRLPAKTVSLRRSDEK
jgi:hypothetical protein